jgi:hypothetical protein
MRVETGCGGGDASEDRVRGRLRGRVVVRQRGCAAATRPRGCEAGRPHDGSVARQVTRPRGCDYDVVLAGEREISETLSLLQLCSHDQMFYLSSVSC